VVGLEVPGVITVVVVMGILSMPLLAILASDVVTKEVPAKIKCLY
jgi:hypothetical protein